MFFSASKIIWILLSPLNLVFLVMLAGIIVTFFSKAQGRSIIILGFVLFAGLGTIPIGKNMLVLLEKHHERPAEMPDRIDGILVLGGSFDSDVSEKRSIPTMNESGERVTEAVRLAKMHPDALLVFSGGNGQLLDTGRTEAEDVALYLGYMNYPQENVIYEDESRNTYENIKNTKELLLPQPDENWVLVTSAFHMPRAYAIARKQGWDNIIPYPVDFRTDGQGGWIPRKFDFLGTYYALHVGLHEFLGIIAYHFTGKITLPLR